MAIRMVRVAVTDETWISFKAKAGAERLTLDQAMGLAVDAFARGAIVAGEVRESDRLSRSSAATAQPGQRG